MKRVISVVVFFIFMLVFAASHAVEPDLLRIRNKVFAESKKMQMALADSGDPVLIISLWDTCVVTVTKLNAYFYMVGIFEMVKEKDRAAAGVEYLLTWLQELQRTTLVNIGEMGSAVEVNDEATRIHRGRISGLLSELNVKLEQEIRKVSVLKQSLR